MSALKYWVWLAELQGLGNQARLALLRHFGDPKAVYYADSVQLPGLSPEEKAALQNHDLTRAEAILDRCGALGLRVMTLRDGDYPARLLNIFDPPCLLYVRGALPPMDEEPVVAMVGTRDCTPYGKLAAEKLGYGLAAGGAVVVTGLARGVDAAASRGALRAGGRVVGVLGCGPDVVYPADNRDLWEDVPAAGAIVSEYPPGTGPLGTHFPRRNRIISGLSAAVLVVEAPEHSGSMITARCAIEQGRGLYAVPGPIFTPSCAGSNRLLRQGAGLVSCAGDLLNDYADRFPGRLRPRGAERKPVLRELSPDEQQEVLPPPEVRLREWKDRLDGAQLAILRQLMTGPVLADDLAERCRLSAGEVQQALLILEMEKLIRHEAGGSIAPAVILTE